jgi:hypothetical protein
MSIEKKSLISTLKTTKKANVASGPEPTKVVSKMMVVAKREVAPKRNVLKREVIAKRKIVKREVIAKRAGGRA